MQKILLFLLFITVLPGSLKAQDTLYYDLNRKEVQKGYHTFYKLVYPAPQDTKLTCEELFKTDGTPVSSNLFEHYHSKKKNLISYTRYYENGKPHIQGGMNKGKRSGELLTWWENGNLKRKDSYNKGKLLQGQCWDKNGDEVPHYPFEIHPAFPGGPKMLAGYLKNNVNPAFKQRGYKGQKILVKFAVKKNGEIDEIEVLSGGDIQLKVEAVRLVEGMPKWNPGLMDGNPIKTTRVLPVIF